MATQGRGHTTQPRPFFNARTHTAEYAGPGREVRPPDDVAEVKIGWFGPADPDHPTAGLMWQAATLAVEEANQSGGYNGLPFRLVSSWSENPWSSGVAGVTRLVYDSKVWAITGAPDGPSAHLVEQIVAKARLAFVSPVATDKTANLANVPWIFSCAPGDHLQAPSLAQALVSQAEGGSFAVVSCTDHDSRMFTTELLAALRVRKAFPARHLEFQPGETGFSRHLAGWVESAAVALIAGPEDSARFLTALRQAGVTTPVVGGPAMGRRIFIETAGESATGAVFPLLWDPPEVGEPAITFERHFKERFAIEPDYTAAYTYDAVNLLIAAIRTAGLNRARIRDCLRELSPWPGVTGAITWDPTGHNDRPVTLGVIHDRRAMPVGRVKSRRAGTQPTTKATASSAC